MLKLGVHLYFTPALSKACHPHDYKERLPRLRGAKYNNIIHYRKPLTALFGSPVTKRSEKTHQRTLAEDSAQFKPGSSGALATIWYSPPFERTDRLHMRS